MAYKQLPIVKEEYATVAYANQIKDNFDAILGADVNKVSMTLSDAMKHYQELIGKVAAVENRIVQYENTMRQLIEDCRRNNKEAEDKIKAIENKINNELLPQVRQLVAEIENYIGIKESLNPYFTNLSLRNLTQIVNKLHIDVGDPRQLSTRNKTNLVSAVNELDGDLGPVENFNDGEVKAANLTQIVINIKNMMGTFGQVDGQIKGNNYTETFNKINGLLGVFNNLNSEIRKDNFVDSINDLYNKMKAEDSRQDGELKRIERERIAEDGRIDAKLDKEIQDRKDEDGKINAKLDKEIQDRKDEIGRVEREYKAADSGLTNDYTKKIGDEKTAREEADRTLDSKITAESKTREEADKALDNKITAEKQAREKVDGEIRKEFAEADKKIREDFATADTNLEKKLTGEINKKQDKLKAGTGINISPDNTISVVNTGIMFREYVLGADIGKGDVFVYKNNLYRSTAPFKVEKKVTEPPPAISIAAEEELKTPEEYKCTIILKGAK